ncbi:hypothetical protein TUM12370_30850 [Salmonella enterica subsp. enterica serovar Choleraesuis]|nr:hypothetical protein TUM12370_30850 [Salmonella enterica subsp. enterica serovar Choleraesuis]
MSGLSTIINKQSDDNVIRAALDCQIVMVVYAQPANKEWSPDANYGIKRAGPDNPFFSGWRLRRSYV